MANVTKKAPYEMGKEVELEGNESLTKAQEEEAVAPQISEKAQNDSRIEQLEAQIKLLTQMLMASQSAAATTPQKSKLDDTVTVVHMIERAPGLRTHIELSNMTIDFVSFGETRVLPRMVFEELIGKYREWFRKGIIAPGPEAGDVAKLYDLKVSTQMGIDASTVKKIPKMSVYELEDLYGKLGQAHRDFILEMFRRGCTENKPDFKDIHKIEMLNRVSGGALDSVLGDFKVEQHNAASSKK